MITTIEELCLLLSNIDIEKSKLKIYLYRELHKGHSNIKYNNTSDIITDELYHKLRSYKTYDIDGKKEDNYDNVLTYRDVLSLYKSNDRANKLKKI